MEILFEYTDEEAYFDVKVNNHDITEILDGKVICKQIILNGQKYNFGLFKKQADKEE